MLKIITRDIKYISVGAKKLIKEMVCQKLKY
jgi:hypothetical protein